MLERRDFLLAEGGTDRDREVAGGIQHQAAALVAGLQAASTGGLHSSDATKLKFTGPSCDVNSLIRAGTKTRAGQWQSHEKNKDVSDHDDQEMFCAIIFAINKTKHSSIVTLHRPQLLLLEIDICLGH